MPMGDGAGDSSSRTVAGSSGNAATAAAEVAGDAFTAAASAQPPLEYARSSGLASVISPAVLTRAQTQLRQDSLDRSGHLQDTCHWSGRATSSVAICTGPICCGTHASMGAQNCCLGARLQIRARPFVLTEMSFSVPCNRQCP